jgi:hypothetical protein
MPNHPCPRRHPRLGFSVFLGLAMVAAGMTVPGSGDSTAMAQAAGPCGLITTAEVQPLAPNESISGGVALAGEAAGFSACRYEWGAGASRHKLDVSVAEASRAYSGMGADQIKRALQASVVPETADAVIADVGEAAVFKADSAVSVHATAYVKNRMLQVHVDGFEAREKKDQVIALLKSAAARL